MRLHFLMAAVALSLTQCTFDATGLSAESGGVSNTTSGNESTGSPTATDPTTDPTTTGGPEGECGNSQLDPGEECDNGRLNNGMAGSICKLGCIKNVCGDGYVASSEGCDDGNKIDDDECRNDCKKASCGNGVLDPGEVCDSKDPDECTPNCVKPSCGDGYKSASEACDDGAGNGDDARCLSDCTLNACGDGKLWKGTEGCDDGNTNDGDGCSSSCKPESCGDGMVDGTEQCDDGNMVDDDDCTNMCTTPTCGDKIVQEPEDCDDGMLGDDKACTLGCKDNVCGDMLVWEGMEECDDGNMVDDDACSNACKAAKCGDMIIQAGEECDDGNQVDDDACPNSCKLCGNGKHDGDEECDDGNKVETDTCNSSCERLAFTIFVTNAKWIAADIKGLAGADTKCNAAATAGKLPGAGTYKAFLSTSTVDAKDRLEQSDKPYIDKKSQKVANDWTTLVSDPLQRVITDENGVAVTGSCENENSNGLVWTNTMHTGVKTSDEDCGDWKLNVDKSDGGITNTVDPQWMNGCPDKTCNSKGHLYCLEQPPT